MNKASKYLFINAPISFVTMTILSCFMGWDFAPFWFPIGIVWAAILSLEF